MHRYSIDIDESLPVLGIDLGYSAKTRSCGIASSGDRKVCALYFGDCINYVSQFILERGTHILVLEAVLSTYHNPKGNPEIRGEFEKGRGWYHGPGVTTFAAALRFLDQLDQRLPEAVQIPLIEGFLSYKKTRTTHEEDARRLVDEFNDAERFTPCEESQPLCSKISGVPEIRRYNIERSVKSEK